MMPAQDQRLAIRIVSRPPSAPFAVRRFRRDHHFTPYPPLKTHICWYYDIDVLAPLLSREGESQVGVFVTAMIAAGGSAAAIKLFQDVLKTVYG